MKAVLLSLHVLAAIVFIGPVTVAASMFPPRARTALARSERGIESPDAVTDLPGQVAVLTMLHRISRGYALAAVAVPILGIATAVAMDVLTDIWLIISLALTVLAGAILAWRIVPDQSAVLAALDGPTESRVGVLTRARQLSMTTGMFALLWSIVVVLMIVRPGSTTGA
jgi:hypothetical protein